LCLSQSGPPPLHFHTLFPPSCIVQQFSVCFIESCSYTTILCRYMYPILGYIFICIYKYLYIFICIYGIFCICVVPIFHIRKRTCSLWLSKPG
jgi:hypothetical protein